VVSSIKNTPLIVLIDKDIIISEIIPHLSVGKRGTKCSVCYSSIVEAILYRLKTGCQWRYLPMNSFFKKGEYTWESVYYHFNNWCKDGSWRKVWVALLAKYRHKLDLSCIQLDGSHSLSKRGGQEVGYQGRKKGKTSNMLFMSDNQGLMLSCGEVVSGEHHDLYKVKELFEGLLSIIKEAGIETKDLFLNADAGFDSKEFRQLCKEEEIHSNIDFNKRNQQQEIQSVEYVHFDEELYKQRFVIERANAWIDSFKALLIRFETLATNWRALHFIAFTIIFIKNLKL